MLCAEIAALRGIAQSIIAATPEVPRCYDGWASERVEARCLTFEAVLCRSRTATNVQPCNNQMVASSLQLLRSLCRWPRLALQTRTAIQGRTTYWQMEKPSFNVKTTKPEPANVLLWMRWLSFVVTLRHFHAGTLASHRAAESCRVRAEVSLG